MALDRSEELTAPTFGPIDFEGRGGLSVARSEFWQGIPVLVTSKVQLAQAGRAETRLLVIEYLRDLEAVARSECECRETVQLIASGRRLLGDETVMAQGNGPFSRT